MKYGGRFHEVIGLDGTGGLEIHFAMGKNIALGSQRLRASATCTLVKPLILRIESRDRCIDEFHLADGTVAAAGLDHDGGHWFDRKAFAVEFDEGLTFYFEDEIDLSEGLVVVRFSIERDVNVVDGGGRIVRCDKGALGHPTRAGDGVDFVEVSDAVVHGEVTRRRAYLFQSDCHLAEQIQYLWVSFTKSFLIFFALIEFSHAAVTVVWSEDGSGVTASYSGFIDTSSFGNASRVEVQSEGAVRNNQAFAYYDGGELRRYLSVRTVALPIVFAVMPPRTGTGSGDPFSFAADDLFVDVDYVSGAPLSGVALFPGETFETTFPNGLDELEGETTAVWIAANGEEMVFYNVVPEPSVLLLLGIGVGGFFVRRR